MWHSFTEASERVLRHASGWSNHAGCDELEAVPLLVGLLSEPECRANILLAKRGVDLAAVQRHWPELSPEPPETRPKSSPKPLSPEVARSLKMARIRLASLPQPLELATEHLLLGLASANHDVAVWLREQGIEPDVLAAEILRTNGFEVVETFGETLVIPDDEDAPAATTTGEFSAIAAQPSILPFPTAHPAAHYRVCDAAANRAREGLRVIEDYVRFVLDDEHLTRLFKQLRHDLTAALGHIPAECRIASRETQADVGTGITTSAEQRRDDASKVLAANFARLQESLRTLEEFGKLFDVAMAEAFKQLRYQTYTLERATTITGTSLERLATARLYVLIDGRASLDEFDWLAKSLIEAGVGVLQLRDKKLADRELLERANRLRDLTRNTSTLFVMNDRPDLAALAKADGVHVGQEELSVKDVRSIVGPEMLIGVSTHSIDQARQAVLDGANYIGVGPTFPSGTKSFEQFPGLNLLRAVAAEIRLPAFAIGGINRANLDQVLATGMTRVAVSGAVAAADNPTEAARELMSKMTNVEIQMSKE
jgi:thiamine-phosphate pyrophosphorylase